MIPSPLLRTVSSCINIDLSDPAARQRLIQNDLPALRSHRWLLLVENFEGRHARPAGYIAKVLQDTRLIRRTLAHALEKLAQAKPSSNVADLHAARVRRMNDRNSSELKSIGYSSFYDYLRYQPSEEK
ncbi:hypothetical protein [Stutzerimonas stutzeri]|uniref:hypothetical protein n=1 Tax=Stutzerimonas stutzeri TaxID=316 RepID=UPI0015E3FFB4|nr:hypothetical protein [Stutzerimonas stutzeri]MBA1280557.1 hypothetical protein [Stutzerimonas stutzeri]